MNRTKSLSKSILISCISSFLFLIHVHGMETDATFLERGLKTGNADEFFSVFKTIIMREPTDNYRQTLSKFFEDKAEIIKKLAFSTEQISYMDKYINSIKASIILLEGGLERVGEDADKFVALFDAIATPNYGGNYSKALNKFFIGKAETIKKLPFSTEQIRYMDNYINRTETSIILLEGGLERVGEDADKFVALFDAIATPNYGGNYSKALNKFFVDKAEIIKKLAFSTEQISYMDKYINRTETSIILLEGGLERVEGDADKFFGIFKAVADPSYSSENYREALNKFFIDKAETIKKLPFSIEQISYMDKYINRTETSIIFLEEGLERAGGDADKFFGIFKAVADPSYSSENYREALNKFFVDKAETIKKLPFSIEQISYMDKYINRTETSIIFLEEGLERAGGDADKFFGIFKAVADPSYSSEYYRKALNKFFIGKAETIKKLPFSTEQIRDMDNYINRAETSIILLEGGLERAGGDADKFVALFDAIATPDPSEYYRKALNKFFIGKAKTIKKLPFSAEQISSMGNYIDKVETSIILLEEFLERAEGDADKFVALFDAIATPNPSENYRKALNEFFADNVVKIWELDFSLEQVKRIDHYVNYAETSIVLLKGVLQQSRGDADKFFRAFKDVVPFFSSEEYRKALDRFFYGNAEEIKKMPFSTEQIRYMNKYTGEASTSIMFLEMGLERVEGDADKFFRAFKDAAFFFPSKEYREALRKFFLEKAETIFDLGLSYRQTRYMDRYINSPDVSAKIFEDSLKKNRRNCAAGVMVLFSSGLNSEANNE